jgi:hypothetical protein
MHPVALIGKNLESRVFTCRRAGGVMTGRYDHEAILSKNVPTSSRVERYSSSYVPVSVYVARPAVICTGRGAAGR